MAAHLSENLSIDEEFLELNDVGGGVFQVTVSDNIAFDNRTDNGKFPDYDILVDQIKSYF